MRPTEPAAIFRLMVWALALLTFLTFVVSVQVIRGGVHSINADIQLLGIGTAKVGVEFKK
jgi:hypothetical protein